jgi:phage terminase large subunit-like protein
VTWDLSCRDWEQRLRDGRSLVPDLPHLDLEAGDRAVAAFNNLRLADVPGTPTMAEAGGDWMRDIVRALFGSYDRATALRMIVEIFLLVPKKNAKTTGGALIMLVALLLNLRPRAPFALMAPVQDTAEEAFEAAAGAIALDPVLEKKLHVRNHLKTIVHRETKADLQIVTFDPEMLTGKKFAGSLVDEVHVIAKNAKASKAFRQVRGGMVPFPEAFFIMITTMPDDEPVGVMRAELAKARAIRDGKLTAKMLPILYEFPRAMQKEKTQWLDPANWGMVNPNLTRSVPLQRLIELYEDAAGKGEGELRGWASQHLNVEIGVAMTADGWPGAEFWGAAAIEDGLTLEQLLERCEVATIGIDGGGLDDLLGLYVLGRERETGTWLGWGKAWAHEIVLERRKEIAEQLQGLADAGELVLVKKPGEDIEQLADIVEKVKDSGLMDRDEGEELARQAAIGVDPVGIGLIVEAIEARGIPSERLIGISQGWKMTGAVKTVERLVAGGGLLHGGQRLMSWCVGNAKVEPRGNAIVITKQASGSAKIDPLMALFDAAHLMALNPRVSEPSFWETKAPGAL